MRTGSTAKISRIDLPSENLHRFQCDQYSHDMRNHFDIQSLHRTSRLKHYGLHFAKYVGRLVRGQHEPKPVERTLVDIFLITLSSANALTQDLRPLDTDRRFAEADIGSVLVLADAVGRFADACEKIDHLEDFLNMAKLANIDILRWVIVTAADRRLDLESAVRERRKELAARQFFIAD